MIYPKKSIALAILLSSLNFFCAKGIVEAQVLPTAPDTGTPRGNSTPGTTRRPRDTCPSVAKPLTALVANNGKDYTLSSHPNFWFYIPYSADRIHSLEFLLLDEAESETIYKTTVRLTDNSGIIKISLPPKPQYALEVGQKYRWYFLLNCENDASLEPDLAIDGWVQRIPTTPEIEAQLRLNANFPYLTYERHQIWFDAIDSLASVYLTAPNRPEYESAWVRLWQSLRYQWLIPESLVGSSNCDNLDLPENKEKINHISLD
jgi:hypothetical protein